MSFDAYYNQQNNYIICKYSGVLNTDMVKRHVPEITRLSKKYGCKNCLMDLREAEPDFTIVELYDMPKSLGEMGIDSRWRRAIIISELTDSYYFYETVCINRGLAVRMFLGAGKALKWLRDYR